MSLQTWKDEFYPIEATETLKENAVQHCLTKWQGLASENLAKHRVELNNAAWVVDQKESATMDRVVINGSTCALCHHYLIEDSGYEESFCEMCPLYKARGDVACDKERDDEPAAPWYAFRDDHPQVQPMIYWLHKAVEYQAESNAE